MSFFTVILRGLFRRPVRTGLTLIGIAIGIAAVVALVGISRGFDRSWDKGMKVRGTDIVVSAMGTSLTPKPFPAEARARIKDLPGIAAISALNVELLQVEDSEMMMVSAREWGGYSWNHLKVVEGRLPKDAMESAVVLGTTAAEVLGKKIGDTLALETDNLPVVGIVDGGAYVENGSVILSLALLQDITGNDDQINILDIRADPGTSKEALDRLRGEINQRIPEAKAMAAGDHISTSQGYKMAQGMSWGTSLLAVFVGVLGVMNTMLMTVFERKQEISVLLALGWRRGRVMRMILWESALLGLGGGILGVALGALGAKLLEQAPAIRGLLQPDVSLDLLLYGIAISMGVGVLSGLYPAWRSSRLSPSAALQG